MNKYKEKIGNILNKIKENKRILYSIYCLVLILFCLVLNVTFSLMTQNKNISGANIIIGDLKYEMVINDTVLSSSVGTKLPANTIIGDGIILLKAGKIEQFNVMLSSLNEMDTKYEIIYKVCTDVNCTSFIDTPSTVQIAYHMNTPYISGTLEANKNILVTLVSNNEDDQDYYVQIDLNVGYTHNELALTNQVGTSFSPSSLEGNLSIIAYVDGVEVETFPTEPNYETGITCLYKNGNTADARGVFSYSTSKGWEIDIFGLNKSLTTCRVDFTEVLKVTYEVLSARYDCANVSDEKKPEDPIISYTGNCQLIQDTENTDGTHTWRMKLLTSGDLSVAGLIHVDAFLVGGGGGGKTGSSPGGGGGYTKTINNIRVDNKTATYPVVIGAGGNAAAGEATTAFGYSAAGGGSDGTGGSAGGNSGSKNGKSYGNGGQGTTTCEFGEGTLEGCTRGDEYAYAAGGGYGGSNGTTWNTSSGSGGTPGGGAGGYSAKSGTANTGSGGGGGYTGYTVNDVDQAVYYSRAGGKGGSGIVVIRDAR
jgi:hypothetical protein